MNESRKILVLTPVKNEAWILEVFLSAVSVFADLILILDQHSIDNSVLIAKKFPKVRVLTNHSVAFNERERQNRLLEEARKIEPGGIFLALDADEIPTPEINDPFFIQKLRNLKPGTALQANWMNVMPDFRSGWTSPMTPFAYADDGAHHENLDLIHRPRLPISAQTPIEFLDDINILHFQYVDIFRRASKKRWYQMWEYVEFPDKPPLDIFRTYNHATGEGKTFEIEADVFSGWASHGVDLQQIDLGKRYFYWDELVDEYIKSRGAQYFSGLSLGDGTKWDVAIRARQNGIQKMCASYARKTQSVVNDQGSNVLRMAVSLMDRLVRKIWTRGVPVKSKK